jgi:hypothetical protein
MASQQSAAVTAMARSTDGRFRRPKLRLTAAEAPACATYSRLTRRTRELDRAPWTGELRFTATVDAYLDMP